MNYLLTNQLVENLLNSSYLEILAVITGIISVWFSKKENFLVYPIGLINTIAFIYLCLQSSLLGEALVNLYYTIMGFYGWYLWTKKSHQKLKLEITKNTKKEWVVQIIVFGVLYFIFYNLLIWYKNYFITSAVPIYDSLASVTAFIGMYLMVKKKLESWYWWMLTNLVSIPLFYYKGLALTCIYYCIVLIIAILGYISWRKKFNSNVTV